MNLLVNLPPSFFERVELSPFFASLEREFRLQKASCNAPEEIAPLLRGQDAVLMWSWPQFSDAMLDENPNLRFCGHIDITQSFARRLLARDIAVSVSRRGFSPAVAEMALALVLACLRRTSNYHAQMWAGSESWIGDFPGEIPAHERQLTGKKVGIVGLGGVGGRLAQLLAPFETQLVAYDPFLPAEAAQKLGARLVSLEELVETSEIVVLCAAANEGSSHLFGPTLIEKLQRNAVFVNVARAALVDSNALLGRLQNGDLFAALDVFDAEPLEADSPFRKLENCYLTPHRAGGILESVERILEFLATDLRAFRDGKPRSFALSPAMIASLDA